MTKEETLKSEYSKLIANPDKMYLQAPSIIQAAHTAMDVYSQQQSIAFAEWIHQNDWVYYPRQTGYWADLHTEGRVLSNEELYNLFLQQSK